MRAPLLLPGVQSTDPLKIQLTTPQAATAFAHQKVFKLKNVQQPRHAVATYAPWKIEKAERVLNQNRAVPTLTIAARLRADLTSYMRKAKHKDAGKKSMSHHDLLLFLPRQQHLLLEGKLAAGTGKYPQPVAPRGMSSQVRLD